MVLYYSSENLNTTAAEMNSNTTFISKFNVISVTHRVFILSHQNKETWLIDLVTSKFIRTTQ